MSNMKDAFNKAGYKQEEKPKVNAAISAPAAKFNLPDNYSNQAEQIIKNLRTSMGRNYSDFTTSKIRNILALISEIYNDLVLETTDELSSSYVERIEYLKVRLVYESGREPYTVRPFVEKAGLLDLLNSMGNSRDNFIKFARYMEALVAYHRFYDGRD